MRLYRAYVAAFGRYQGTKKYLYLQLIERWRVWIHMGGQVDRHPQHEVVWVGIGGFLLAIGLTLRFSSALLVMHVLGYICLALVGWIALSFLLPLWLPPIRNAEVVRARREANDRKVEALLKELSEKKSKRLGP